MELFEKSQTLLNIKRDELGVLRKRLAASQREKELLFTNTSFFQSGSISRRKTSENLIASITSIEQEIASHHPLPYPERLQDAQRLAEGNCALFNYVDLNLHRLEELAHAYKKRLFVVEASQDSEREIFEKYGSIQILMQKVEEYEKENLELKTNESSFIDNPVGRRRKFAEMSPFCARHFAVLFKVMLESEQRPIATFRKRQFKDQYEESKLIVDSILADPGFSGMPDVFDTAEFGNTTEPDLISNLIEAQDGQSKVTAYREIVKKMDAGIRKLRSEIKAVNQRTVLVQDGTSSRADKLMEAIGQLFERIDGLSISIDRANDCVLTQFEEILRIAHSKSDVWVSFIENLGDKKALVNSHIELIWKAIQNRTILTLLLSLTSCFGRDCLQAFPETPLAEVLKGQFGVLAAKLQEEDAIAAAEALALAQEASQNEEADANEPITAAELLEKLTAFRRRKRDKSSKSGKVRATEMSARVTESEKARKRPAFEVPKFFARRPKLEVLHGLALAAEASGFVIGVDKQFRRTLREFVVPCIMEAHRDCGEKVKSFGDEFMRRFSGLNVLANSILVTTKESIAVETEAVPMSENESQTGDIKKEIAAQKKK
jgi:hypothetical protein